MSGEYRARECKANIVIVPTTSSYELDLEPQHERTHRKRAVHAVVLSTVVVANCIIDFLYAVGRVRVHLQSYTSDDCRQQSISKKISHP